MLYYLLYYNMSSKINKKSSKKSSKSKSRKLLKKEKKGQKRDIITDDNINDITSEEMFKLIDLYYDRKHILYSHLYNPYNKLNE